jgi:hypothetical protein
MRLMLVGSTMMLALAIVLFVRARVMSEKALYHDGLSRLRDAVRGRYPDRMLEHLYSYLSTRYGSTGATSYRVLPGDELRARYGLVALELEDAVLVIADRGGARLPKASDLDLLTKQPMETVEDLMRFLEPFFRTEPAKG